MQEFRSQEPTEADMEAILRLAALKSGSGDVGARERMLAAAEELGISREALAEAEREYMGRIREEKLMEEFREHRLHGWRNHLITYLCVNSALILMNLVTSPGRWWFVMPLIGWGIGMAIHTGVTLSKRIDPLDDEYLQWLRRRDKIRRKMSRVYAEDDDDD